MGGIGRNAKDIESRRVHFRTITRRVFAISDDGGSRKTMPGDRSKDRRVQKTRDLLHGALASLIHAKSYDAIVVKEILGRANVGRSTFYTHFRDKDELLDSGIRDALRANAATSPVRSTTVAERILRFSLPLFEHIERQRGAGAPVDAQRHAVVHEHVERMLVEIIADDLRRAGQRHRESGRGVPCELLAKHVASTFVLVLNWWVESEELLPARTVDEQFRALVLPSLTELLD
jgi:AcrR family transcriptional regulator